MNVSQPQYNAKIFWMVMVVSKYVYNVIENLDFRKMSVYRGRTHFKGPLPVGDRYEKKIGVFFSPSFSGFKKYFSMGFFLK